ALRGSRLRNDERTRNLLRREAAEDPQRQCDAALGAERRMAGREDEPQEVVADVVVGRIVDRAGCTLLPGFHGLPDLGLLLLPALLTIDALQRAVLRDLHEPCAGFTRNAVSRPCLERGEERVLGELLGRAEVATNESSKPGHEACPLDSKDSFDSS